MRDSRGKQGGKQVMQRDDSPKGVKAEKLPDTIPMLTSTAVQVEEPMKSHVTSVDEV